MISTNILKHARHSLLAGMLALLPLAGIAKAQNYPSMPVRIIVPFAPGGTADILARMVAKGLGDQFGQSFLVENKTGANGALGTEYVARAKPDGYTILMGYLGTLAISPALYNNLPFDPLRDLAPITNIASTTQAIVARKTLPAKNIAELIALAKSGQTITFASAGVGSPSHMAGELFNAMANIKMVHVPYKGSGAVLHDLIGGHVDISFGGLAAAMPSVKAGELRLLGVTSAKASPGAPDTPTVAQAGLPGYEVTSWFGLLAPAGTPKPIIDLLHDEVTKIANEPDFKKTLALDGAEVIANTPEEFHNQIKADISKWAKVVKDNGIVAR
jgi:tripartite-type tricarboxylate transporter receptor subunit TctC